MHSIHVKKQFRKDEQFQFHMENNFNFADFMQSFKVKNNIFKYKRKSYVFIHQNSFIFFFKFKNKIQNKQICLLTKLFVMMRAIKQNGDGIH